jgi:hypothetical protein
LANGKSGIIPDAIIRQNAIGAGGKRQRRSENNKGRLHHDGYVPG